MSSWLESLIYGYREIAGYIGGVFGTSSLRSRLQFGKAFTVSDDDNDGSTKIDINQAEVQPGMIEVLRRLGPHTLLCADVGVYDANDKSPPLPGVAAKTWACQVSGRLFQHATGANQPIWHIGEHSKINGRAALQFDDTNDFLQSQDAASTWRFLHGVIAGDDTGCTVLIAFVPLTSSNTDTLLSTLSELNSRTGFELYREAANAGATKCRLGNATGTFVINDNDGDGVVAAQTLGIVSVRHAIAQSPDYVMRVAGGQIDTADFTGSAAATDPFASLVIGNIAAGTNPCNSHIGTIAIWNRRLTDDEMREAEEAVARHYGGTLV